METLTTESLKEIFSENLVRQIRATDAYGAWEKLSNNELLEKKFLKPEGNAVKDTAGFNVKLYLQAAAVTLEKLSGKIIGLITENNCDGSVRTIFYTGQFLILEKSIGSMDGFYFGSVDKLVDSGIRLVEKMNATIEKNNATYKEIMG